MTARTGALAALLAAVLAPLPAAAQAEPKPVDGFDGKTIRLGLIQPLTGPAAVLGQPVVAGVRTWFDYLNKEKGGIAGKYKVELVAEDHQNQQAPTVQAYNKIKTSVVMIAQLFGTHTTLAVLPQVNEDKMLVGAGGYDYVFFKEPQLLPVGAPYQIMAVNALSELWTSRGFKDKTICALIRDDPYGTAGLEGVEFAAKKLGFKLGAVVRFSAADQDFSGQMAQLKGAGCQLVYVTTIPPQFVRMVGNAVRVNFAPLWLGQFPTWSGVLVDNPAYEYMAKNLMIASEGPEWGDMTVSGMARMVELQKKYAPDAKPDFFFTIGYKSAEAATQVLEAAVKAGDLSHAGLAKAYEGIASMSFGGITGDHIYGAPDKRRPPLTSSLFKVNKEKPYGLEAVRVNFTTDLASQYIDAHK
ncbi:ABC transporter substrate-binding protein [Xanthobacter aminoxidans]|uniref:ABC transporter substrate-binding protein n=1 Tax=Xanthobacter aminoxidans TaxID=186280 RepID=UPI003727D56C